MSTWKNININKQNIETETSISVLFKMPHKSNYDGFVFWHPAKLVREGRNSSAVSVGYTDDFTFRLKKYGKRIWDKFDVIDEVELNATEFEEEFDVMNDNITAPKEKSVNPYETHKPEELKAEKTDALEELKDD